MDTGLQKCIESGVDPMGATPVSELGRECGPTGFSRSIGFVLYRTSLQSRHTPISAPAGPERLYGELPSPVQTKSGDKERRPDNDERDDKPGLGAVFYDDRLRVEVAKRA